LRKSAVLITADLVGEIAAAVVVTTAGDATSEAVEAAAVAVADAMIAVAVMTAAVAERHAMGTGSVTTSAQTKASVASLKRASMRARDQATETAGSHAAAATRVARNIRADKAASVDVGATDVGEEKVKVAPSGVNNNPLHRGMCGFTSGTVADKGSTKRSSLNFWENTPT
jgi:hypothetical protein